MNVVSHWRSKEVGWRQTIGPTRYMEGIVHQFGKASYQTQYTILNILTHHQTHNTLCCQCICVCNAIEQVVKVGGPFCGNGKALVAVPLFNGRETKRRQDVCHISLHNAAWQSATICVIFVLFQLYRSFPINIFIWNSTSKVTNAGCVPYLSSQRLTKRCNMCQTFSFTKITRWLIYHPPFFLRHTKQLTKLTCLI